MVKRILILDEQEYTAKEIKEVQSFINETFRGIKLLLDPDKIMAICDIKYSHAEVCDIFGEAYISINGGS